MPSYSTCNSQSEQKGCKFLYLDEPLMSPIGWLRLVMSSVAEQEGQTLHKLFPAIKEHLYEKLLLHRHASPSLVR